MEDTTILFNSTEVIDKNTKDTLKSIYTDLEERGYNPTKQIVGYLLSGDPGFISSYKECRSRITKLERNSIIELMLKEYLKL
jgi:uncharacterized protein (UPF0297 family)